MKEAGHWSDAQEAHNKELLKRQQVLAAAWTDYGKSNPPADDKANMLKKPPPKRPPPPL